MSGSAIKAVCFDAFGTLVGYTGAPINPYRHLLPEEAGARASMRSRFLTENKGIEQFAEDLGLAHLIPVLREELKAELAGVRCFAEVAQVLQQLREAGVRLAVCSNLAQAYGPVLLERVRDLDAYVLSFEVGAEKPEPAIYAAVCDALGKRPSEVLFIGDSQRCDLHGPQAFGMRAQWLNRKAGETLIDALGAGFAAAA